MRFCVLPFCVMPLCVLPFCVTPFCVLTLCVLPLCVMPCCVLALCVMPLCVLPFSLMPFSAWYLYDSGFFSISSFYRGLFFTNFDAVNIRFDLTLFTFRSLNFVTDIPSYELTDSWKRTKLNGKGSDLPDRISSALNVSLSNINVDGYICNECSYRDLKRLEKILEDAKSLQPQSFTTNNRTKRCVPSEL